MPRKGPAPKRPLVVDPVYGSPVVTQLVNRVLLDGKKSTAERIVYGALEGVRSKTDQDPVSVLKRALDNIRPALYEAAYTALVANRRPDPQAGLVRSRVVGKHCESGDVVVRDVDLPADLAVGDVLAVPATGAYGRSMASNYTLFTRPGVRWVREGESGWVVRPETIEDLLRLED